MVQELVLWSHAELELNWPLPLADWLLSGGSAAFPCLRVFISKMELIVVATWQCCWPAFVF